LVLEELVAEKELLVLLVDLELKEEIAFLVHSLHMAVDMVEEMVLQDKVEMEL
tara:strand:+ start:88 stop:246 length:159 start_codon:yes stop_codon:yes gene_type:complete